MKSFVLPILIGLLWASDCSATNRTWPDGNGGLVRGKLILIRQADIVILTGESPPTYTLIPRSRFRDTDRRYIARFQERGLPTYETLTSLPNFVQQVARIEDGASLLQACANFRGKSKAQTSRMFAEYQAACEQNQELDEDHLWFVATLIFEHPAPLYPNFWRSDPAPSQPDWPTPSHSDLYITHDLPFLLPIEGGYSGPNWPDTHPLMTWVEDHAKMRSRSIAPDILPTLAADSLTRKRPNVAKYLRAQAWRMVAHLFPVEWDLVYSGQIDDIRWARLHEMLEAHQVEWSPTKNAFAAQKKIRTPPPAAWLPTEFVRRFYRG